MSKAFPSADKSLWKFTHETSGRTYLLYESLSPADALAFGQKQKQLRDLVDRYCNAAIDTQASKILADLAAREEELWVCIENTFQRCLRISPELTRQIDYNEASSVFTKVVEYCLPAE